MAKGKEPILVFDVGGGVKPINFYTPDEALAFFTNELQFYERIAQAPNTGNFVRNSSASQFQQFRNTLDQVRSSGGGDLGNLNATARQAYTTNFPLSVTPVGKLVLGLLDESPEAAATAVCILMNLGNAIPLRVESMLGAFRLLSFMEGLGTNPVKAYDSSIGDLYEKYQHLAETEVANQLARASTFEKNEIRNRKFIARGAIRILRRLKTAKAAFEAEKDASIGSITATEKLYREQMKIRAPATYWTDKAKSHKVQAEKYKDAIYLAALPGSVLLIGMLFYLANHTIDLATADKPSAVYFVLGTIGIVISTIAFWAMRIIVRLFLSEHHLAIDSEERAVMAQTYLALTAEEKAEDKDRAIVLGSLFRPTADGIVKDDAAPETSIASIISRMGAK